MGGDQSRIGIKFSSLELPPPPPPPPNLPASAHSYQDVPVRPGCAARASVLHLLEPRQLPAEQRGGDSVRRSQQQSFHWDPRVCAADKRHLLAVQCRRHRRRLCVRWAERLNVLSTASVTATVAIHVAATALTSFPPVAACRCLPVRGVRRDRRHRHKRHPWALCEKEPSGASGIYSRESIVWNLFSGIYSQESILGNLFSGIYSQESILMNLFSGIYSQALC